MKKGEGEPQEKERISKILHIYRFRAKTFKKTRHAATGARLFTFNPFEQRGCAPQHPPPRRSRVSD